MLVVPRDEPIILYSNVPESDEEYELFDSKKTYNLGDKVQFLDSIFESLKDNNTDEPIKNISSMSWFVVGSSNRYKLLDDFMNTSTSYKDELVYEFKVNDIDTICFFGLQAENVKIEIFNDDEELMHSEEKITFYRFVSNWWEWTVQEAKYRKVVFFRDIPSFFGARLKVTISFLGSDAVCSNLVFGKSLDFGVTITEPAPISTIKKKEIGKNIFPYKRVTLSVVTDTNRVSLLQDFIEENISKPLLFIGVENMDLESLVLFGFCKEFEQPIGLEKSVYQVEIEGVI